MMDDHSASRRVGVLAKEAPHLLAPSHKQEFLRDEIVRLVNDEIMRTGADLPASIEALDELGATKAVVVDSDGNCFRVTVELI